MSVLIEARDVSVGYGQAPIVRDLNLQVHPGEVVALLGANGAGKTTTLLALAGELRPLSGSISWNGSARWSPLHKRAREGLTLITEGRSVFSQLTAKQNLAIARRCDFVKVVEIFPELEKLMSRRGALLSGGEQQMLTVGQALARPTKLLLADELSLGLAPRTTGRLLRAVRAEADKGLGALIVEQHVHRALEVANRVYVMRNGVLEMDLPAEQALLRKEEIQQHYLTKQAEPLSDRTEPSSDRDDNGGASRIVKQEEENET